MTVLRLLSLACLMPLLAGCAGMKTSDLPAALALEGGNTVKRSSALTDGRYAALLERAGDPGARAMLVGRVERRTKSLVMLASRAADGTGTWLTEDGGSFSFRDGMLVATRKVPPDLIAADASQTAALVHAGQAGRAERFHSYLDGDNQVYMRSYVCDVTPGEVAPLELLNGSSVPARVMTEDCAGQDETFRNYYWVAPGTGEILISLQYASSDAGAFLIQEARR